MNNKMIVECPDCHYPNDFSEGDRWQDAFIDDARPVNVDCKMCGNDFWVQPILTIELVVDE